MATAAVCPVVGTTNTVLPPDHPSFDPSTPDLVCPITNANTSHHSNIHFHPSVHIPSSFTLGSNPSNPTPAGALLNKPSNITTPSAAQCPALQNVETSEEGKKLDEQVCPVVGPVTTVLPPNHPSVEGEEAMDKVCPVTNATLKHHLGKVVVHPPVESAEGKVCPVSGKGAAAAA